MSDYNNTTSDNIGTNNDNYLPRDHVEEITPGRNSQGEHAFVEMRGCGGDPSVGEVSVDGVVVGRRRRGVLDAETGTQTSTQQQQQLEGMPTAVSGSPVSSVGGWREHGKMLGKKQ